MSERVKPRDEQDVAEAVSAALAAGTTLEVVGAGTKRALGRPSQTDGTLDLSALAGVTLYEPGELVLSVKAATPLAEIAALLAQNNQTLAFEPMDLAGLLSGPAEAGTIGGVFACNLSGPRRLSHGAARDVALGARAVSGRGEVFKSGGRVVKNVTGYDLPRLFAGSFGTLGVLTEITLKVLPRPETQESVLLCGLTADAASRAMSAAMGSSCEVSGAAFLPEGTGAALGLSGRSATLFRLEGFGPSVTARRAMLLGVLAPFGAGEVLDDAASAAAWAGVRDVKPFAETGERALWRISTAPTAGPALGEDLKAALGAAYLCDWAGGLLWLLLPGEASHAAEVRAALAPHGGHATLLRASASERARTEVFQPLDGPLAALNRRVKESFDPKGLLNPGRMYAGV